MRSYVSMLRVLAAAGALFLGGAAAAEPINVEYFVQQKAFKSATAADQLSFELFSDDQCTTSIAAVPLFVGDTTTQYYIDKTQRVKGAAKRPKAVRIRAVIDGPTTATAPYLMVTGPGVVPVGDACQLQAGSPVSGSGPTGPAGPQGPAGADGATGPAGADGATGPAGPAGADGATGPAGADGATGPAGPAGADGATGPAGPPGADGATGPAGADGADGAAGPAGPAGADGATGPAGPAGADGATGPAGPAGADGATGPAGPAGADGATGPAGPAGADGADGTSAALMAGNYSNANDGVFLAPFDASQGAEGDANQPMPSGQADKLLVVLSAAPTGGLSTTLTLRKNGVDTGLTCTVPTGQTTCSDLVDSVSFADGDFFSVRYNESGGVNTRVKYVIRYRVD